MDRFNAARSQRTVPLTQAIAAGCASFSLAVERDDAAAVRTIRAARDAGVTIFDTARAYATVDDQLHNETLLARAVGGDTDVVIMTKGGHFRKGYEEWGVDNSPERLRRDVDDSLRALGVDRIGVYFVHRADGAIDIAESFGALEALRQEGKIESLGISNATSAQITAATAVAPLAAVQNRHTFDSDDALDCAQGLGLAFFVYSPLGGPTVAGSVHDRFPRVARIADERGISAQRLVLRGILAASPVLSVVVGAGRPETARDSAAAPSETWDDETRTALEGDLLQGSLAPAPGILPRSPHR